MFSPNNKEELQLAIHLWCEYEQEALARYGPINKWDVSSITDMVELFRCRNRFNYDISMWDVSNVRYV